jgi:hypothetical protein
MAEELPDLPDYSAINRAVPQMPSGMQKEEECVSFTQQKAKKHVFYIRHLIQPLNSITHKHSPDGATNPTPRFFSSSPHKIFLNYLYSLFI